MTDRTGEKVGWTAGWLGGFIWVAILSASFFSQGKGQQALLGLLLFAAAIVIVLALAPWRHPSTHYGRLMIAPYGVLLASVVWAVWSFGNAGNAGLRWWIIFWFLPLAIPLGILWQRRWVDFDVKQGDAKVASPR
jgi:hypothetical protein